MDIEQIRRRFLISNNKGENLGWVTIYAERSNVGIAADFVPIGKLDVSSSNLEMFKHHTHSSFPPKADIATILVGMLEKHGINKSTNETVYFATNDMSSPYPLWH